MVSYIVEYCVLVLILWQANEYQNVLVTEYLWSVFTYGILYFSIFSSELVFCFDQVHRENVGKDKIMSLVPAGQIEIFRIWTLMIDVNVCLLEIFSPV